MTEDEKFRLRAARYQWVVTNPYPETAKWQISPHKAWMDGFNFAWDLVERKLNEVQTTLRMENPHLGQVGNLQCRCDYCRPEK
jgi:hypothetical protein